MKNVIKNLRANVRSLSMQLAAMTGSRDSWMDAAEKRADRIKKQDEEIKLLREINASLEQRDAFRLDELARLRRERLHLESVVHDKLDRSVSEIKPSLVTMQATENPHTGGPRLSGHDFTRA